MSGSLRETTARAEDLLTTLAATHSLILPKTLRAGGLSVLAHVFVGSSLALLAAIAVGAAAVVGLEALGPDETIDAAAISGVYATTVTVAALGGVWRGIWWRRSTRSRIPAELFYQVLTRVVPIGAETAVTVSLHRRERGLEWCLAVALTDDDTLKVTSHRSESGQYGAAIEIAGPLSQRVPHEGRADTLVGESVTTGRDEDRAWIRLPHRKTINGRALTRPIVAALAHIISQLPVSRSDSSLWTLDVPTSHAATKARVELVDPADGSAPTPLRVAHRLSIGHLEAPTAFPELALAVNRLERVRGVTVATWLAPIAAGIAFGWAASTAATTAALVLGVAVYFVVYRMITPIPPVDGPHFVDSRRSTLVIDDRHIALVPGDRIEFAEHFQLHVTREPAESPEGRAADGATINLEVAQVRDGMRSEIAFSVHVVENHIVDRLPRYAASAPEMGQEDFMQVAWPGILAAAQIHGEAPDVAFAWRGQPPALERSPETSST